MDNFITINSHQIVLCIQADFICIKYATLYHEVVVILIDYVYRYGRDMICIPKEVFTP